MATGIVSRAMSLDGAGGLSGFLLGARIVAYVLPAASYVYRSEFLADVGDPRRAFAFFTFVAGVPTGWPPIWAATCIPQRRYRWPSARPGGRG